MLNWRNFAEASPKLGEIGVKLAQVGSHWQQVGLSWPKLAALVRPNLKKCSLPKQGAQKQIVHDGSKQAKSTKVPADRVTLVLAWCHLGVSLRHFKHFLAT